MNPGKMFFRIIISGYNGTSQLCTALEQKGIFEGDILPAVVTDKEIESEMKRAENMEQIYKQQADRYESGKSELASRIVSVAEQTELAFLRMKMEAAHRAALESRLSWLYTWKKQRELETGRTSQEFAAVTRDVDADIQDLANQLNLARIEKRVSEYAWDFYTQLSKEEALKED